MGFLTHGETVAVGGGESLERGAWFPCRRGAAPPLHLRAAWARELDAAGRRRRQAGESTPLGQSLAEGVKRPGGRGARVCTRAGACARVCACVSQAAGFPSLWRLALL